MEIVRLQGAVHVVGYDGVRVDADKLESAKPVDVFVAISGLLNGRTNVNDKK